MNWHIVLYYRLKALQARHNKQWLKYEFVRQWYINELERALE